VAWFKDLGGVPFDARVLTVVEGHRKTFESLGCIIEQAEPDFAPAEIAFRVLRAWSSANTYGERLREHPDAFKDTLRGEIEEGLRLTSIDLAHAEVAHGQLWRRFQAFLEKYEYFVLPTTQLPPFEVDTPYPTEIAGVKFDSYIDWMKSCWYISATGNPAASVPAGFTSDGLPVGVQIVGRNKEDFSVLQMAHVFEQATRLGKKRVGKPSSDICCDIARPIARGGQGVFGRANGNVAPCRLSESCLGPPTYSAAKRCSANQVSRAGTRPEGAASRTTSGNVAGATHRRASVPVKSNPAATRAFTRWASMAASLARMAAASAVCARALFESRATSAAAMVPLIFIQTLL
jgi:hypothetical protein